MWIIIILSNSKLRVYFYSRLLRDVILGTVPEVHGQRLVEYVFQMNTATGSRIQLEMKHMTHVKIEII